MIDLSDPRTPTWPELRLQGHLARLRASLGAYLVTLALFWANVAGALSWREEVVTWFIVGALCNYIFLVWTAYFIQRVLHESGLGKHGGWQVWVGALLLNPAALGWYIPVSVMLSAGETKRKLLARWPNGRRT